MPDLMNLTFVDVNRLQINIMVYIDFWVKSKRTPIPQKEIIIKMQAEGIKDFTTVNALKALTRKGYIRRGLGSAKTTTYVQLRKI